VLEWGPHRPRDRVPALAVALPQRRQAGAIPRPHELTATKVSGLAVDSEYTFQARAAHHGRHAASQKCKVRTHGDDHLTASPSRPGLCPAPTARARRPPSRAVGARWADARAHRHDALCVRRARGPAWERRASSTCPSCCRTGSTACEAEARNRPALRAFYLDADPRLRASVPGPRRPGGRPRPRRAAARRRWAGAVRAADAEPEAGHPARRRHGPKVTPPTARARRNPPRCRPRTEERGRGTRGHGRSPVDRRRRSENVDGRR